MYVGILDILIKDCRTPYLEIARLCHVSGGTIHVRMKKMEDIVISVILKCMSEMARMYLQAAVMEELYTTIIIQDVPL